MNKVFALFLLALINLAQAGCPEDADYPLANVGDYSGLSKCIDI